MSNQKEVQLYQEDPLSDFVYTNQAYHDILEYIKYVSDEDHLKHIPDYLPVYLLSGGFDNLTKMERYYKTLSNIKRKWSKRSPI